MATLNVSYHISYHAEEGDNSRTSWALIGGELFSENYLGACIDYDYKDNVYSEFNFFENLKVV